MASDERTEYLLQGHRALFNQNPSKKALMEHIKLLVAELEQNKAAPQPDTVEPAAWLMYAEDGRLFGATVNEESADLFAARTGRDCKPLYAHPPAKPGTVAVPRELLTELADDLESEIEARRSGELDRRIERDLLVVREARALLDQKKLDGTDTDDGTKTVQPDAVAVEREVLIKELLHQSRKVRNYSNPEEVFEAVPVRAGLDQEK